MKRGAAGAALAAVLLIAAASGCMRAPSPAGSARVSARARAASLQSDSVTVGLWHLDETGGTEVADAGPFRLEGYAGVETGTDFGRFGNARSFLRSLESYLLVPYNPVLDTASGFTIEAWIRPSAFGPYEDTPIAARWTLAANEQSWLFGIVGSRLQPPRATLASPGWHDALVQLGTVGHLVFAFQPSDAGPPRSFFSTGVVELDRWTHVAATYEGQIVRLYIDGQLDAQFATLGAIRPSPTPLVIGNFLDPRWLSDFGGDLRVDQAPDPNPYYAYQGLIDEVRLSSAARRRFDVLPR